MTGYISGAALDDAVRMMSRISEEFAEEVGGVPTLGEFLCIVGSSIPAASKFISGVVVPVRFKVELRGVGRNLESVSGRTAELNDSVFVAAAEFTEFLARQVASGQAKPVSLDDLASALLYVLSAADFHFGDAASNDVLAVVPHNPKRVAKAKVGDVLAIPVANTCYRMASVVARNRFGTAIAILPEVSQVPRVRAAQRVKDRSRLFYTDDRCIAGGVWLIVGHDDALASLFPAEPEIYHAPDPIFPDAGIGKFGAAESPDGKLRQISQDEARSVGLVGGSYRQIYLSSHLQQLLAEN